MKIEENAHGFLYESSSVQLAKSLKCNRKHEHLFCDVVEGIIAEVNEKCAERSNS